MTARTSNARPSLLWEARAGLELTELTASPVFYGVGVPHGDGAPVLAVPGFLAPDESLAPMRTWLRRTGYQSYRSGIRFCAGDPRDLVATIERRAAFAAEHTGRQVTLIGHSFGGILSCAVARQRPDLVAHVITLGSALFADPQTVSHPLVAALGDVFVRTGGVPWGPRRAAEAELFGGPLPPSVRLSCLYTRTDAVIDWRACSGSGRYPGAHEVRGTHAGLIWNVTVYRTIARLLARSATTRTGTRAA